MEILADTILNTFSFTLWGNSLGEYAICLAAILIGILIIKLFKRFIFQKLKHLSQNTSTTWDDILIEALEANAIPSLYLLVFYLGLHDLSMSSALRTTFWNITLVIITILSVRITLSIVSHGIKSKWITRGGEKDSEGEKSLNGIINIAKIIIWILGCILLLDNLGIKVSGFVAGLGITGIAVALAAQTILGDLFSYFVIFFDQPFEVGHAIKVDQLAGEVEHIGLKTTRLRGMDGEEIVVSNKFLTDSRVQNFKRMEKRRISFSFEVEHDTPPNLLKTIPETLKSLFQNIPDAILERSHLKDFTSTGIRFETIYFLNTPNYGRYMDIQQEINLGLHHAFFQSGIHFASIYLHSNSPNTTAPNPPVT